jgi:hypothetical protein
MAKKSSKPPRDVAQLAAFNANGEVVLKRRPSLYRYYEDENPLNDRNEFRASRGIVRLEGKLYDGGGRLFQEFEIHYSDNGAVISTTVRHL